MESGGAKPESWRTEEETGEAGIGHGTEARVDERSGTELSGASDRVEMLCAGCGYSLTGLGTEVRCPECGRAVQDSQASARRGSPWERRMSVVTFLATTWSMSVHPLRTMRDLRNEMTSAAPLMAADALAVGLVTSASMLAIAWGSDPIEVFFSMLGYGMLGTIIAIVALGAVFFVVCGVSHVRRYRRFSDADMAAAAHACAVGVAAWVVWVMLVTCATRIPGSILYDDNAPIWTALLFFAAYFGALGVTFGAPLYVLVLALYGRRANRFANPSGVGAPAGAGSER